MQAHLESASFLHSIMPGRLVQKLSWDRMYFDTATQVLRQVTGCKQNVGQLGLCSGPPRSGAVSPSVVAWSTISARAPS